MHKSIFIMLLLLTGSWYTYGQYQRDWVRHYGRTLVSESRSIIEVSDGSLLVSGYTIREGSFRADAWLIKLDPLTGRKVWEKKYGEKDWDEVTAVVETSDHHLMVLGWTHNRKGKRTDTWLMRLDLDGKLIWEKFYGDKRWDEAFSIVEAKDGGFAIAACVNKRNENDDIHLFKIDKQGEVLWDTILGGDGRDKAHGIYSLRNGDILAVGYYSLTKEEKENGWAGRFSLDGDLIWEYKFGGEATDALHDAVELENGQIILVGFTRSHNEKHQADLWVVKLNADGQVIHEKTFGEHKFEKGRKIVQTRDGGFAIAGFTLSKGMGKADIWVLKLNKDLELEWEDTFGGGGYDVARTMIELDDGALVIAGKIDLLSTAAYLLVRYNRQNGPSD